jgi:ABC-type glycerol-3-phosphate transport system substrate-binding protein
MGSTVKFICRICVYCVCIWVFVAFSGCGREEESGKIEYYDIVSEVESLFAAERSGELKGVLLGMQYYQGEPVQLWSNWMEGDMVYLSRTDGSREDLMEIPHAKSMHCYLDQDGNIYCWEWFVGTGPDIDPVVWMFAASGQEVCQVSLDEGVIPKDICQNEDGRILMLLREEATGALVLAEFDAGKGDVSKLDNVLLGRRWVSGYIAFGLEDLFFLEQGGGEGVSEISLENGKREEVRSFQGGNYILGINTKNMTLEDFRVAEDGSVEILWASRENGRGVMEKLQLKEMEKAVLTIRTIYAINTKWLKEKVIDFNKQSEFYHLIVEHAGTDPDDAEVIEYGQAIAMQMGAGKGPDILMSEALDFVDELAGRGGIVDLAPYMVKSGMREEDYFPTAFSHWRDGDKIYTVSLGGEASYNWLDGRVLGLEERPEIGTLLEALLAVEEPGNYIGVDIASGVLTNLIQYTDDYCGIIDWEKGICNFEGELFSKMMQVAGRYGYTMDKIMEEADDAYNKPYVGGRMSIMDIYEYETLAEMEAQGKIPLLSAEGNPYGYSFGGDIFAINANSEHIEGAWEFLAYLMSDEVQRTQTIPMGATSRVVCMEEVEKELRWLEEGNVEQIKKGHFNSKGEIIYTEVRTVTREDITDEKVAEYISMKDRAVPGNGEEARRMKPIWQIIWEESEAYFVGDKSIEEVADIINNRVQLYLDENR